MSLRPRTIRADFAQVQLFLRRFSISSIAILILPLLVGATSRTTGFNDRLLAAQNRARSAVGVAPLVWNPTLAAHAKAYADHLSQLSYLVHSVDDPSDPDPEGENLWAGTKGYYSAEDMVGLWVREKRFYKGGLFPHVSRTGRLEDVGHYTQVVWRSTRQVGCALSKGRTDEFLVCRYSEGGNVIGEATY